MEAGVACLPCSGCVGCHSGSFTVTGWSLNAADATTCLRSDLPSAAEAHRTSSDSIPTDSSHCASIPVAAGRRHLAGQHLKHPPRESLLFAGHTPPPLAAAAAALQRPVRPPLKAGAIAGGQVDQVWLVNNTSGSILVCEPRRVREEAACERARDSCTVWEGGDGEGSVCGGGRRE